MRLFFFISILSFLLVGCQTPSGSTNEPSAPVDEPPAHHVEALTRLFDGHGGYAQWTKMNTLSYLKGDESTVVDLKSRQIRLESPTQTIGFDGTQVWIAPDSLDASRTRFYHNLFFYFYAMPFVVGDPGAFYEEVPPMELQGKSYEGIKVSFGEGVGDAPDDNYILWVDPATNRMEWLMYTVTYRSGEPSETYSLIRYDGWKSFNGLLLPTRLQWHQFDGETVGDPRGEARVFTQIAVSETAPDPAQFRMPEGAKVAPR